MSLTSAIANFRKSATTTVWNPVNASNRELLVLEDWCEDLRRKNAYCLGFIPAASFRMAAERNRLLVETQDNEPVGFVLWAKRGRQARIHQCVVEEEFRRLRHASRLVAETVNMLSRWKIDRLRMRVADDLPANGFWQSIGCRLTTTVPGGKTWGRTINIYDLPVRNRCKLAEGLITGISEQMRRGLASW